VSQSNNLFTGMYITYNTVNEFDVSWTLRIAVTSSVFGTSLVGGESGHTTVSVHLREVNGAVETAREVRNVDIESEFLVEELEHLVRSVAGHQVHTGTDVLLRTAGDEFESDSVSAGGDTVCAGVVSTFESAVGSASRAVWAERGVPGVASVAVGKILGAVEPAPVGVEDDLSGGLGNTAGFCALLPGETGVGLCGVGTDLLAHDHSSKRESNEGSLVEHF